MPHFTAIARIATTVVVLVAATAGLYAADDRGILVDLDDRHLVAARLKAGDAKTVAAMEGLIREAESAMLVAVRPITEGKSGGQRTAPSGDPRDYVSLSPYWWPDPDQPDGLPYIRHDGKVNPDRYEYDTPKLEAMGETVRTLGFAYHLTGDEKYAERALEHIRPWFINPETRMIPRVKYAQFVPGIADGRHVGIIDTNRLRWVPDAMLMLSSSPAWTTDDTAKTKQWFSEYVDWLLASELGKDERNAENNHGTWYAAQTAYYASYADRDVVVKELVSQIPARIGWQIEPDGSQPEELVRTIALHYCDFNLRAMLDLSRIASRVEFDLAGYETEDGRSIKKALDWVYPYMAGEQEWTYPQIKPIKPANFYQCFRLASRQFGDPKFEKAAQSLEGLDDSVAWVDLIIPAKD